MKKRFLLLRILFVLTAFLLSVSQIAIATEKTSDGDLHTFQNILEQFKLRKDALDRLLVAPTESVYDSMFKVLQNPKETIAMKHTVEDGFVRSRDQMVLREIERLAFMRTEADEMTREICLSIIWKTTHDLDKGKLAEELLHIANNSSESHGLRRLAIGYLSNAKIKLEHSPDWADKIAANPRESVPVRTAALNYMEYLNLESLAPIMSEIIRNTNESQAIREITILKAARLQVESLKPDLEFILLNKRDKFEIRKMCLNMLSYYGFSTDAKMFLTQLLAREENEKMITLIQGAIDELNNKT